MDLEGLWTRMPKNMSGGQKRRLDIVMGLINEPSLVFLDVDMPRLDGIGACRQLRADETTVGATIVIRNLGEKLGGPGTYTFFCKYHPTLGMFGTIVIK